MGFLIAIAGVLYCLPMLIAYSQDRRDADWISAVNLLLGWTLAGWVIALVRSCSAERRVTGRTDAGKALRTSEQ